MVINHYQARCRVTTATDMAISIGYNNFSAANAQYGRLGSMVAEALGLGKLGVSTLVLMVPPSEANREWLWVMRENVTKALEKLKWVKGLATSSIQAARPKSIWNYKMAVKSQVQNLALSVRQPYAEWIMLGKKKIEYRSISTKIRGRVYIYASRTITEREKIHFKKMKTEPADLPTGQLVGSVEVIDCLERDGEFHWLLANPQRLKKGIVPKRKPQPVWFRPFEEN